MSSTWYIYKPNLNKLWLIFSCKQKNVVTAESFEDLKTNGKVLTGFI
jgi:hypothetical protein